MIRRRSREDLEEEWTLGPDEHALLAGNRGATRLGFAITLRFLRQGGPLPEDEEIDGEAVSHVARQIGVPAEEYASYDARGSARPAKRLHSRKQPRTTERRFQASASLLNRSLMTVTALPLR